MNSLFFHSKNLFSKKDINISVRYYCTNGVRNMIQSGSIDVEKHPIVCMICIQFMLGKSYIRL